MQTTTRFSQELQNLSYPELSNSRGLHLDKLSGAYGIFWHKNLGNDDLILKFTFFSHWVREKMSKITFAFDNIFRVEVLLIKWMEVSEWASITRDLKLI